MCWISFVNMLSRVIVPLAVSSMSVNQKHILNKMSLNANTQNKLI